MSLILLRKILRDLRARRASLVALVFIMAFGISSFICFLSVYRDTARAKDNYYRQNRLATLIVRMKRAPASVLEEVRGLPNVASARGRISMAAVIGIPRNDSPISGMAISLPAKHTPILNDVVLRAGTWFSRDGNREILVTEEFAKTNGLIPGDHLKVLLMDEQHDFLITGLVSAPEYVYLVPPAGGLAPDPARFGAVYLPERFLQEASDLDGAFNQILISVADDSSGAIHTLEERLKAHLDLYGVLQVAKMIDQPSPQFLNNELENVRKSSTMTPLIFLGAAALILNVLVARLVNQQRGVIGTLKAIGYTSRQVLFHYVGYGVAIGTLGALAGVVLGAIFHNLMLMLYRKIFSIPNIEHHFYPDLFVGAFVICILAAVAGTLKGVRAAARLAPAAAMQPPPPEKGRRIALERIGFIWRRMSFRTRMIMRDIFRNPFRSLVSILVATLAMTMMEGAFCMRDALMFLMRFEYQLVMHNDLSLSLRDPRGRHYDAEEKNLPGVAQTESQLNVPCDLINGNRTRLVSVTGIDGNPTLYTPVDRQERPVPIPASGIILTKKLAEILDVRTGDFITLHPLVGERRKTSVRVEGTIDTYVGLSAYASLPYLSRLIGEEWAANTLLIKNYGSGAPRALIEEVKERPQVTAVGERARALAQFEGTFGKVNATIIGIFVLFAGLIGFGSVLNSSLVSLSERQRAVGTLRVLGYTPGQIAAIFAGESAILYTIGSLIGIYTGTLYVHLLVKVYSSEIFRFPAVIRPERMVQSVIVMTCSMILAQFIVYRLIAKMNWIDVLKVKE
ncbi:ABC transporter permease [Candidatus Sumerlaeota bacterium]|nr:ABC transporter permease [Candidatus Sumerlaeota bacterium]